MDAVVASVAHTISAWDGLPIRVLVWDGGHQHAPVVCLPGLVRTSGDFEILAPEICAGRRVIAIDYPGRGASCRSPDINRYGPEACLRDIMDACAALNIHHAVAIGTSFGGLLTMGLAVARPGLIKAAILNDIGPDVADDGANFVREFVAEDPALDSLEACVTYLRARLPPLSLETGADWRRMVELTYAQAQDGRFRPVWDIRIAQLLDRPPPDLWALFGALAHIPLLLVRGEVSNILLPGTVARMQTERPDMRVVTLPGIGHAPVLTEPMALAAIHEFLAA